MDNMEIASLVSSNDGLIETEMLHVLQRLSLYGMEKSSLPREKVFRRPY